MKKPAHGLDLCSGNLALQMLRDICERPQEPIISIGNTSKNIVRDLIELGWGNGSFDFFTGGGRHPYDQDEVCMALAMLVTLDPPDPTFRRQVERAPKHERLALR